MTTESGNYEAELLDFLEALPRRSIDQDVWRVTFEGQEPVDESIRGHEPYRRIGGAVAFLGLEGLLVPSLRYPSGDNLVIYADNVPAGFSDVTLSGEELF